jgi:hypothetical protein
MSSCTIVELPGILKFVRDQTGSDEVFENSDIAEDLGVDGDDFDELINNFAKKFNVDISPCLWYFHFTEEGNWNSIGGAFFSSPDKRVKRIPVTPSMLFEFARKGKWDIQYPEHQLPERRYDIIINQLLIISFLIFTVCKCAVR